MTHRLGPRDCAVAAQGCLWFLRERPWLLLRQDGAMWAMRLHQHGEGLRALISLRGLLHMVQSVRPDLVPPGFAVPLSDLARHLVSRLPVLTHDGAWLFETGDDSWSRAVIMIDAQELPLTTASVSLRLADEDHLGNYQGWAEPTLVPLGAIDGHAGAASTQELFYMQILPMPASSLGSIDLAGFQKYVVRMRAIERHRLTGAGDRIPEWLQGSDATFQVPPQLLPLAEGLSIAPPPIGWLSQRPVDREMDLFFARLVPHPDFRWRQTETDLASFTAYLLRCMMAERIRVQVYGHDMPDWLRRQEIVPAVAQSWFGRSFGTKREVLVQGTGAETGAPHVAPPERAGLGEQKQSGSKQRPASPGHTASSQQRPPPPPPPPDLVETTEGDAPQGESVPSDPSDTAAEKTPAPLPAPQAEPPGQGEGKPPPPPPPPEFLELLGSEDGHD